MASYRPGKGRGVTDDTIRQIVYRFGDASVAPEFHRSYEITLTPDRLEVVVDSYGEVLAQRVYDLAEGQFDNLMLSLERNVTFGIELEEDEGGTGGTSETISLSDGEKTVFYGTVYHCGGKDSGDLAGDVKRFADDVKGLVPDLEKLLDRA